MKLKGRSEKGHRSYAGRVTKHRILQFMLLSPPTNGRMTDQYFELTMPTPDFSRYEYGNRLPTKYRPQ
jgi:hypothetical protein